MKLDMSQEKEMVKRELMPEGDRILKILQVDQKTSKAGNEMLEFSVEDQETGKCDVICAVMTQGKRWALKNILFACGVVVEDGEIYVFEIEDLIDKTIIGKNKHIEEEFTDRKGELAKIKKNKFSQFYKFENPKGEEIPF